LVKKNRVSLKDSPESLLTALDRLDFFSNQSIDLGFIASHRTDREKRYTFCATSGQMEKAPCAPNYCYAMYLLIVMCGA
jgi:hypothetical protein